MSEREPLSCLACFLPHACTFLFRGEGRIQASSDKDTWVTYSISGQSGHVACTSSAPANLTISRSPLLGPSAMFLFDTTYSNLNVLKSDVHVAGGYGEPHTTQKLVGVTAAALLPP